MSPLHCIHSFVAWLRAYTNDQRRVALQIFLSFCIISAITFPSPIWNALTYDSVTPPIALVLISLVIPQHQGGCSLAAIFMFFGISLGGVLAIIVKYITFFANGSNWVDETVVKAVVYTLSVAITAGFLNALRWQWEITNQFFLLVCAGLIFNGGITTYYSSGLVLKTHIYMLIFTVLAAVVTLLCCWFIFPVTAGSKYRELVASALLGSAQGISAYEFLVLGPVDPTTGKLSAATGKIDPGTDTDVGLIPLVDEIRKHMRAARKCIFATRVLNVPVRLEIDIYNTPKLFPYMEYMHSKIELSLIIATVSTLTRPVKSGRMDLTLFQRPELRSRFAHLLQCLQTQFQVLAGAVQREKTWREVDTALEELDFAWIEFLDEGVMAIDCCTTPDAAFGLRGISAFLYLVGSRTRSLYAALAGAVDSQDPEAIPIAVKRMQITPGWVKSADAFRNPLRSSHAALAAMQKAAHVDNEFISHLGFLNKNKLKRMSSKIDTTKAEHKSISKALAAQKSFTKLITAAHALGSSPTRRVRRVYNIPLPVIYGFQYAVALGIATALTVVPVIWQKGFHNRPMDVCVTVVVVWQPNIGTVHGRALNRIFGTFLAAIWSYVLLSLSFAASGATWDNTPGKLIVAGFLAAIWAGFCTANMLRYPEKQYGWLVAGVTVPIVTLSLLRGGPSPPWAEVAWRLVNVCMGVVIVGIVAFTVFPLSARTVVNANFSAALTSMAELLRQLPHHLTPANADTPNNKGLPSPSSRELSGFSSSSFSPPSSPFGSALPITGTNAFRQAFLAPVHAAPIRIAFRIQRALADVAQSIPILEGEYLPFSQLHRVPQGATATAAHAAQLMLDFLNITFALKMDNSAQGPWRIPALQHKHMTAIACDVADALDSLRDAILGDQKSIATMLKLLDKVHEGIERQVTETLAVAVAETEIENEDDDVENIENLVENGAAGDVSIEKPGPGEVRFDIEKGIGKIGSNGYSNGEEFEQKKEETNAPATFAPAAPPAAAVSPAAAAPIKTTGVLPLHPTPSKKHSNKPPQLQLEVLVLLYLGISVSQQLKILCSATARAFLAENEAVVAEIDRKALEPHLHDIDDDENIATNNQNNTKNTNNVAEAENQGATPADALSDSPCNRVLPATSQRLEYLMARVLESTHSWPTSQSASSFTGVDSETLRQERENELIEIITSTPPE